MRHVPAHMSFSIILYVYLREGNYPRGEKSLYSSPLLLRDIRVNYGKYLLVSQDLAT